MKNLIILLLLFTAALANVHPHPDPIITHVPKVYKVKIQDSPIVRWAPIIKDFEEPLSRFMHFFDLIPFPKTFFRQVEWFAKNQFKYQDFVAQVDAIAKLSGFPFDKLFFLNFMYELSTVKACTGVVARNSEGKIIHGRNLDFNMWLLLSNLVANIQYYKGDKLLYSVDTVVGSVFTLTANRPGAFSVEVNTRGQAHFQDDFISILVQNDIPTCWLLRNVVNEETNYASAVDRLKKTKIAGPVYFVVSGVKGNQGIVIERDSDKVHASYQLTDSTWYLVQTNYDRNVPDPQHDQRRLPAENRLKKIGKDELTQQLLFDAVMKQTPTLNIQTIYTVVMVSDTGYHNTTVWYGQNPNPQHSGQLMKE